MDCRKVQQRIDLFIDGTLSGAQAQELEQHVSSCAACKKALDDALRLKKALSLLGDKQPPAGLAQSAIKKARRRPVYAYISAATAVAAAAIVLVAVLSTGRIGGGDDLAAAPEEPMMFSAEMASEEAAPMEAPAAYDGGLLNGMAEDSVAMDAEQRSTAGLAKGSELGAYATEAEFAAAYGESYYRPLILPEGAVLESIAPSENALVFAYRLGEEEAYVFEWLTEVPAGGLEAELHTVYGSVELFAADEGYYVLQEEYFTHVYWEQDGQVFRTRLPAGMDYKAYSVAEMINP